MKPASPDAADSSAERICDPLVAVADHLLPNTQLRFASRNSQCDPLLALSGALYLTREAFAQQGVVAIIGAGCSNASVTAALVAGDSDVPIISPSSLSPTLSDGRAFPYFLRTVPSDGSRAESMVDVLQHLLEYSSGAVVSSDDGDSTAVARTFADAAANAGMVLNVLISFTADAEDFTMQHRRLQRSREKAIVLICESPSAGSRFVRAGLESGTAGEGYLWFFSDAALSNEINWVGYVEERRLALHGSFALALYNGEGTDAHAALLARRIKLPSVSSPSGTCSSEKDSEGGAYLWQHDHDANSSTPLVCSGDSAERESAFDAFGYDAVFAVAHALHDMIEVQNKTSIEGSQLLNTLIKRVRFEGVTGAIAFHDSAGHPDRTHHGDRREGFSYQAFNFVSGGLKWLGSWTPCRLSEECSWEDRWTESPSVGLTFSTPDNSRPIQTASCLYGEVLDHAGRCICDNGFEFDATGERCQACDAGRDSRRATVNASGSSGCSLCAEDYYRLQAHLPATDCTSCTSIRGVYCPLNVTMKTIFVIEGYWRHSGATLETHRCKFSGSWSPCLGGDDVGEYGNGCERRWNWKACCESSNRITDVVLERSVSCCPQIAQTGTSVRGVKSAMALCNISTSLKLAARGVVMWSPSPRGLSAFFFFSLPSPVPAMLSFCIRAGWIDCTCERRF